MFKSLYILVFFNFVTLFALPLVAAESTLTFCVEETEFPPFNYFLRQGKEKTTELAGYDIDVLERVFAGVPYKIVSLPWRRCLMSLNTGAVDAAMSASMNEQRRRDYISSEPYYYLTPGYFFLAGAKDTPTEAPSAEQLSALGSICGLGGHNYANFGLAKGKDVLRMIDYQQLAEMLNASRCRFFLDRLELLPANLALMDKSPLPPLEKGRLTGSPSEPFFMLISPKSPKKDWIKMHFNQRVSELRQAGELAQMLEQNQRKLKQQAR